MRHQRARVLGMCQFPETVWWRLAALTAYPEQLFVQSTANLPGGADPRARPAAPRRTGAATWKPT
jgi:hypothetical protein